jgi:hypothetical protein
MSAFKQKGTDVEKQNSKHHSAYRSRHRLNVWVCDKQVSLVFPNELLYIAEHRIDHDEIPMAAHPWYRYAYHAKYRQCEGCVN